MGMVARDDDKVELLTALLDVFNHIAEHLKGRNTFQRSFRITEHMEIGQLENARRCHGCHFGVRMRVHSLHESRSFNASDGVYGRVAGNGRGFRQPESPFALLRRVDSGEIVNT